MTVVQLYYGRGMTVVRMRIAVKQLHYACGITEVRFAIGSIPPVKKDFTKSELITVNLPEPSGAKILGIREGKTNTENAIVMAAVASRT